MNTEQREFVNLVLSSDAETILSPQISKTLERFDLTISNIKETSDSINNTLNTTLEIMDNASIIWNCTMDTIRVVKELDVVLKEMDVSLQEYLKDADVKLDKFKVNANIVEKQLDKISDRIDRVLDNAFKIDSKTCTNIDLELRSKLITQVRDWSDHISSLLMKLMGA